MKNKTFFLTLIISLLFAFTIKGQITGPSIIQCGDLETYSIPNLGQCQQCYDWDAIGDITIVASDTTNTITIIAGNNAGSGILKVTYFNETGCHVISLPITISCTPSPSCCSPELNSYFICGWSGTGHGGIYLDFTGNGCDRSSVSRIDWILNGAVFSSGQLMGQSSGTTYGPGFPGNIESDACDQIHVTATIHYNNGCPNTTLTEDVYVDGSGFDSGSGSFHIEKTLVYPNPTKSEINIEFLDFKKTDKIEIKLFDLSTGKEVYLQKVLKSETNKIITINHLENYKALKIVILNGGIVIKQETILIN